MKALAIVKPSNGARILGTLTRWEYKAENGKLVNSECKDYIKKSLRFKRVPIIPGPALCSVRRTARLFPIHTDRKSTARLWRSFSSLLRGSASIMILHAQ